MLDHKKIKLALRNAVRKGVSTLPDDSRIAFENVEFTPPEPNPQDVLSCMWLRESYVPGDEIQAASDTVEGPGVYTLDILVPKGCGTAEVDAMQKAVAEVLHPATAINDANLGVVVHLDRTVRMPGREENGLWYVVSVQCTWRSYDIG